MKQAGITAFLLLLGACSGFAFASSPSDRGTQGDEQAIRQIENQWINASRMSPGERLRFFEAVLAPDGIHIVDSGQRYTHGEILDYYRRHPQPPSKPRARFKELNIRINGDTAIAEGITVIAASAPEDQHEDRFTDVFEKRNERWLAVSEQETRIGATPGPAK